MLGCLWRAQDDSPPLSSQVPRFQVCTTILGSIRLVSAVNPVPSFSCWPNLVSFICNFSDSIVRSLDVAQMSEGVA